MKLQIFLCKNLCLAFPFVIIVNAEPRELVRTGPLVDLNGANCKK